MIYVDIKYINNGRIYDLNVNETVLVNEVLKELGALLDFTYEKAVLISKNRKEVLNNGTNLFCQGIKGGDTLLLIVSDNSEGSVARGT